MTYPTVDGDEFRLDLPDWVNDHVYHRLQDHSDTYAAIAADYAAQGIYSYTINGYACADLNALITEHAPQIGTWGDPFLGGTSTLGFRAAQSGWPAGQVPENDVDWYFYLLAYMWGIAQGQMYGIMLAIQLNHFELGNTGRPKGT